MTSENPAADATADAGPAPLTTIQARILGCLIEKEATTPEAYPLTANAVVLACNQKTSREPLMELEPGEVGHALRELEGLGAIRSVHGARAQRYEHRFAQAWSVTTRQQALLCVLMLRGPQTLAELHTRCERIAAFADLDEVRLTLERLAQRTPALALNLGRGAGQREDRYMHLLSGAVDAEQLLASVKSTGSAERSGGETPSRIDALEAAVAALRAELDALKSRLP
ncbi:YceH family protein [Arenimonas oryziterrae]|uniref:Uncharacterized protein n=1 Tax=Arenimonas oryziterrae DSM 21050 = YC6267 TaxID=1121015 RepID=A0A091ARM7_9GAMM|nr:DUF480 domain-containing protein [Arenimonas oryziterrae]KFN42848.1 hypothetical protein N789_12005 [Arenimonas oryziterrae DSM 21050 = YC6267]